MSADVCEAALKHGCGDRSKSDIYMYIYFFIYRLKSKIKLLNRTLRRLEQFGPVRSTSRTMNQLYADPIMGQLYIYIYIYPTVNH